MNSEKFGQKSASQFDNSSGGTSVSFAKLSKFEVSHGPRTVCTIGAVNVRFVSPSQSKPWNHLKTE